jgi:hypothetical protein
MTVIKINARNLNEDVIQGLKEHYENAELEIRVHDAPDSGEALMDEDEFWGLIDLLDWSAPEDNNQVVEPIIDALSRLPKA